MPAADLRPLRDLSAAEWVVSRMTAFEGRVRDLVPGPFAAYVRVFHRPDQGLPDVGVADACWAEVAEKRGTTLHPAAQWDYLAGWVPESSGTGGDPTRDGHPLTGTLDRLTLPLVRDVLARHAATTEACHLALWVGHGHSPRSWDPEPTFRTPGRQYWLFEAPLAGLVDHAIAFATNGLSDEEHARTVRWGHVQSPQLWWPEDRAWAVASEIDYDSTIVAGSEALAAELLAATEVECLRISPDESLYVDADTVNRA